MNVIKRIPRPKLRCRRSYSMATISIFDNYETRDILKRSCYKFAPLSKFLYKEFIELTEYHNYDTIINITKLLNKYSISSAELFYTLYTLSSPVAREKNFPKKENVVFTIAQAEKILQEHQFYIDYYNGTPIKIGFRKNKTEEQLINIKKFDDCTYPGCFYDCIVSLLYNKNSLRQREIEEL